MPGVLSPVLKLAGREYDHSSSTSAEVKKILIYKSTPPNTSLWRSAYVKLVKLRDKIPLSINTAYDSNLHILRDKSTYPVLS
jgi:hypothetical protein